MTYNLLLESLSPFGLFKTIRMDSSKNLVIFTRIQRNASDWYWTRWARRYRETLFFLSMKRVKTCNCARSVTLISVFSVLEYFSVSMRSTTKVNEAYQLKKWMILIMRVEVNNSEHSSKKILTYKWISIESRGKKSGKKLFRRIDQKLSLNFYCFRDWRLTTIISFCYWGFLE